ncbi:MAG: dTMP kinase [Nitrospira sp.]|nr:dTMP kinase [Nitrospira sp.]
MSTSRLRRNGLLITFEGVEGSGKTTQLRRLATILRQEGYKVVETREPGGTSVAERIREVLLTQPSKLPVSEPITVACELMLVLAARSQHIAHVVDPALRVGSIVLCDRFSDSTLAYQGYGRGLDLAMLKDMNRLATGGLTPDLTLLLEVPVTAGLIRRQKFELEQNRLDREASEFHGKVRRGFLALAAAEPKRIRKVDGVPRPETVAVAVAQTVHAFLTKARIKRLQPIRPIHGAPAHRNK